MFVLSAHLLFLLGIVGVSLGNRSLPFAVVLLATYGIGLYHTYRRGRSIRKTMEAVLAILSVPVAVLYALYQGQHILLSLQYWLALMLVIRSFRRMEKRDYSFCFLVSAALFAHVGRTYDDMPFLLLVLAVLLIAPYALFHFMSLYGGFQKTEQALPPVKIAFSAAQFRYMTGISFALFLTALALFLAMPRARGSSMLGTLPENRDKRTTGFTDNAPLGAFGEILTRSTVVMTVETDRPALWRGGVLDYYEAGIWYGIARYRRQTSDREPALRAGAKRVRRVFEVFDIRLTNFQLCSSGTILSFKSLQDAWRTWINDSYATITIVQAGRLEDFRGRYEVVSGEDEYIGPAEIPRGRWSIPTDPATRIDESEVYQRIPVDLSQAARNLAKDLTKGLNTPEEKADAIQRYLSEGFTYSLKGLNSGDMPPLDYFLFKSKAGHCEYFASAMAVLLRCAGVSTRVVQGFAPGTLVDGKYVVRLSDAHLWTEVFCEGKGWKAYDPTPGRAERLRGGQPMGLVERLKLRWQSDVLNYDRAMQTSMFEDFHRLTMASLQIAKNMLPALGLSLAGVAVLGLIAFLLKRFGGSRFEFIAWPFRRFGRGPPMSRVRSHFGDYLRELARKGYKRSPGTTPNDLLAALHRDRAPIVNEASFLTRLFYDTRFGDGKVSRDVEKESVRAVRRVRKWAR